MPSITFITKDGKETTVEGTDGTVMELAVKHNIKGIDGDCGGVCSCATCHVHVAPEYMDTLQDAADVEKDMLEFDDNVNEYSRLSCQIRTKDVKDGTLLRVAN